jgi:ABC-type multidrug transport system ATPase subunit
MIEIRQLVKRYGAETAVDGLDFTLEPGVVTRFLGPSGAGKPTTMRPSQTSVPRHRATPAHAGHRSAEQLERQVQ